LNKLTKGDCVAIFGREWAESEDIRTAADMAKPATNEQQKLAEWVMNATKPKAKTEVSVVRSKSEPKVVRKKSR
jgi:hypothetical protein